MKKLSITLTLALALTLAGAAQAKTTGTTIDFEGLTPGTDHAADQVGGRLTTWSDAPGGAEDGNIVADPAGGSGQVMRVDGDDDIVLSLGEDTNVEGDAWQQVTPTTLGAVTLAFDLYVESGAFAYWNIQSSNGTTSKHRAAWIYGQRNESDNGLWGFLMAEPYEYSLVEEGAAFDAWVSVEQTFDLDNGTCSLSINDSLMLTYTVADGFDFMSGLLGVDFYGKDSDGMYYVDNITFNLETTSGGDPVPEPATLSLLGLGLAGMAARRLRRKG